MPFLILIPIGMVLCLLALYPIWLIWFERSRRDDGSAKNRVEVVKMLLFEHQLFEQIKEMKKQMQEPMPKLNPPTILLFNGQYWDLLRLKNKQAALDSLRRLSWTAEVPS